MTKLISKLPSKRAVLSGLIKTLFLAIPFILMDLFIRIYSAGINYFVWPMILPTFLFSAGWILFIVLVSYFLNGIAGKIFYSVSFITFFILFLTHLVYYSYTGFFFCFRLLESAEEGSAYIWNIVQNTSPLVFIICLITIASAVFVVIKFPKREGLDYKKALIVLASFAVINFLTPFTMGPVNKSLEWDNWRNPRNVYESFNDSNKNIKICGLYEYTFKDFITNFFENEDEIDPEELAYLRTSYKTKTIHAENSKTGIFEGKNFIFLQLEGVDSWLFNPEDMPNTYALLDNSINFTNHFSYYTGGGSTFNSELAVTTGLFTPISYTQNPYAFHSNKFSYSLPKMLKSKGYRVNAFHMNSGEYYNRELNYKNWGYDNYYGLIDDCDYSDATYMLDTELINNDLFYKKMFKQKEPFMNYIITYTPHTPFNLNSSMGKLIAKKEDISGSEATFLGEEEVARLFAKETDDMIGLLMQALKDNGLYENTVIVAYADHYLYTLNDKTILDKYKKTNNNIINRTPFFIWSDGLKKETVSKVNSQIDILPTVLNMAGINYCDEYYIGSDIFDSNYGGYVFFSDYSWYDGNYYVEYGEVVEGEGFDEAYIAETNALINDKIHKNDLTLKYDYFSMSSRE